MEGAGMEENNIINDDDNNNKSEAHLTSAAAFVEGGIQDACDDACSICLEAFCDSDPSTVTSCKHEFHLQCILEWCQRSSQCPMCWQPISLKDPTSQELLEAVERERNFRFNPSRNATIFHHPTLGDFELQHLPVGASDADLEERIIQHLAAAAAMGRARHIARREGQRNRSSAQGRPHFLAFSTNPNSPPMAPASSSPSQRGDDEPIPTIAVANLSPTPATGEESSQLTLVPPIQAEQVSASGSGSTALATDHQGSSYNNRRSPNQSSPSSQDRAGPSELQSFSESLKSKLNAVSTRYKESISKSTRGWKERWFSRNNTMSDLGSEVRREVNAGIATVSRMMERLETSDNNRSNSNSAPSNIEDGSVQEYNGQTLTPGNEGDGLLRDNNTKASCAAGFSSN
uniref:RING-type E3 ubiquitin transferase n=1 Tax=Glycine max TaxID=3847 RepID=C6TB16_SOYBN|nr:unknown [Glycine max]